MLPAISSREALAISIFVALLIAALALPLFCYAETILGKVTTVFALLLGWSLLALIISFIMRFPR
jgi:hypothetical protein